MRTHSLKKRYITKLLSNIVNALINVILVAIVPKALGPVAYGQFTYLQNFFSKAIGFLDMGTSMAFFIKLSARNDRKELIVFYFLYSIAVLFVILFFIYSIESFGYLDSLFPNIPNKFVYFGLFYGFLIWFSQVFIKISDAYALTVSVEKIKIIHKFFSLLLLLYFIYRTSFDLKKYFYFHYIALISFIIILSYLFYRKNIFTNLKLSIINYQLSIITREFVEYCHPLMIYNILGIFAGFFDIWLLQKIGGSVETGYYGLAYSFGAMCFLFTSAMTPIIMREFSKYYEEKNFDELKRLYSRYVPMLFSIAAYFGIFISFQSKNVLAIFTNEKFSDAYLVVSIMAFYPLHQTFGQLSGSLLYASNKTKLVRNISFFTMPLGMIVSLIFIYFLNLGAVGLALKMIIIQFIGTIIQLYFNTNFLNISMKAFLLHQIKAIIFFVIIAYIVSIIDFKNTLVTFLIAGCLYTVLVIIGLFIFPDIFALKKDEIKRLLNVIKTKIKK